MAVLAFGDDARAWAHRFQSPDRELIVVDPSGASAAFLTAIETKKRGEAVIAAIALDEPRAAVAQQLGGMALNLHRYRDERSQAFDEIAAQRATVEGRPQASATTIDPRAMATLVDFARLADRIVVRSWTEMFRLSRLLAVQPRNIHRELGSRPLDLPRPSAGGKRVVVWGPHLPAASLALIVYGLSDLRLPVTVVCKTGRFNDPPVEVVEPSRAAEVLADAQIVVDASLSDPHDAVELARLGYRVVPAVTSGAQEYLDGVFPYFPWAHRHVAAMVRSALALGPPPLRPQPAPASPDAPELRRDGPLVSLIVRTYNRRRFLERALASIAAQSYRNFEAVVVNDAGEPVDDIVARFPFARPVVNDTNLGTTRAANVGLEACRGTYVGLLDDDDLIFPDHLSHLVDALERSGAGAASSHAITTYLELTPFSDYATFGYRVGLARHIDRAEIYVRDPVAPMAVLMRRTVVDDVGPFDENIEFAEDWEMWIRIAERYDVVHVPRVTGIYSVRSDNTNTVIKDASKFAEAFAQIVATHPLEGRPLVDAARTAMIETSRVIENTPGWGEPAIRFEPPRPLP